MRWFVGSRSDWKNGWDCGVTVNRAALDLIIMFVRGAEEKLPSDDDVRYLQTLNVSHMMISYCNYNPFLIDCSKRIRSDIIVY